MYHAALLADPSLLQFRAHPPRSRTVARARRRARDVGPARRATSRRRPRWTWLAVAAAIVVAAGGLGYLRVWPPLATVMSASMAPTIKTGDIVILKKLGGRARVGDVVAISVPENIRARFGYPPVVIHRVVRIDADGLVRTKGDAHKDPDPFEVPSSAVTTKVVATVPAAGRMFAFLGSGLGLLWLAGGALMFVAMPLLERSRDGRRREVGDRETLQTALTTVTSELTLLRDEQRLDAEAALEREAAMAAELRSLAAALTDRSVAASEREAALAEQLRAAALREEALRAETAQRETALARQLSAAQAELAELPAQIERAVAAAVASLPAAPPPPPPPPAQPAVPIVGFIAASSWRPPTEAVTTAWDAPPPGGGRFQRAL